MILQSCRQHRDRFKKHALNAPRHLGYTHQLCPLTGGSETTKIEHIKKKVLKKMTPHPEKAGRTFHKLMWQKKKTLNQDVVLF